MYRADWIVIILRSKIIADDGTLAIMLRVTRVVLSSMSTVIIVRIVFFLHFFILQICNDSGVVDETEIVSQYDVGPYVL